MTWNNLVAYPYSFPLLAFHAESWKKPMWIVLGYVALLITSESGRENPQWFTLKGKFEFRDWFIGCSVAGSLTSYYSKWFSSMRTPSQTERILAKLQVLRRFNYKIVKHVMKGSMDRKYWCDVCKHDADGLFSEFDQKWNDKLGSPGNLTSQALWKYMNMFNIGEVDPVVVTELLYTHVHILGKCKKMYQHERRVVGGGRRGYQEKVLEMRIHLDVALSRPPQKPSTKRQ